MMKLSHTWRRWKDGDFVSLWSWRKDFREKWVWKEKREVERILEKREWESEGYVKMRWVVRFMQVGVGLVRVIRS